MNPIQDFFDRLAPSWDSMESTSEERLNALLNMLPLREGDLCLDVACGTGVMTPLLQKRTGEKVEAIDLSAKMIEIAKKKYQGNPKLSFRQGDFLENRNLYDFILIYNAYPHFLEAEKVAKAVKNSLKEGGRFAILHSFSRQKLEEHHSNVPHDISRDLKAPEEESEVFLKEGLQILRAEESESHYLIIGEK